MPTFNEIVSKALGGLVGWVTDGNGAALVRQRDANNNTIGGAFCPSSSGADLTAAVAVATQTLTAGTGYVHFDVMTAAVRVKFGVAGSPALTGTTGTRIQSGTSQTLQVPVGADRFQYIRDGAAGADGSINYTEG